MDEKQKTEHEFKIWLWETRRKTNKLDADSFIYTILHQESLKEKTEFALEFNLNLMIIIVKVLLKIERGTWFLSRGEAALLTAAVFRLWLSSLIVISIANYWQMGWFHHWELLPYMESICFWKHAAGM